jgi:predicted ATPase
VATLPVLLLLVGERGEWLQEVENESRLILESLDREQTESALCANFLGLHKASEVAAVVHERVQGDPQLLQQFLTEQVQNGLLAYGERGWAADLEALRTCALPLGSAQALQGRVDALSGEQQQALSAAALFGGRFVAHWVAAALGCSAAEVLPALESLTWQELVLREESPVSAPVYRLAHPSLVDSKFALASHCERHLGDRALARADCGS